MTLTVEKIGGTSMSRANELLDTLFIGQRTGADLYNRVFVVSAFGGITNLLLEHKKTGQSGVYALFADADNDSGWMDALNAVASEMIRVHGEILSDGGDRERADAFVRDRVEGARACMIDLQRLCSYGHFRIESQLMTLRELLSGLGEAHSAFVTTLLLNRNGVNARFIDLTGWRDDNQPDLAERLTSAMSDVDVSRDLPIVTGYAQCREGLMSEYDRGYTEVVFAHLAASMQASEAIIHKEFHLSSADPKIVGLENVRQIGKTNYDVADQLSNLGMEAIHPNAAKILRQAHVPLRVMNAFDPGNPGTFIGPDAGVKGRVEMVTGLGVYAFEVFEPDMVGAKGYDAAILEALTRHKVWIVSKTSNANCITHWLNGSLKSIRRVERDVAAKFPNADITTRNLALVSAIGSDMGGLSVMRRALQALEEVKITPIAMQQGARRVDTQIIVEKEHMEATIKALHAALIEGQADPLELADGGTSAAPRAIAAE
ncbi:aspartate kinase [Roseicitreum antarcticum]|nr:aspartate kinase [Roseicitreum antarcticum]